MERLLSCVLEHRVIIDIKGALFGIMHDLHPMKKTVVNLCILVAKMCVSKYKYGKPYCLTIMFDNEMRLRVKQLPYEYRGSFY